MILGMGARAFALLSQLVILLAMSRILPKEEFGDAMIAFALYRLVGLALGTGFANLLIYHIGRSGGDPALDIRLSRSVTLAGLAVAGAATVAFALLAGPIAALFAKPGLEVWLVDLAPLVLFGTLNLVIAGSFDGRSQVNRSIVVTEVVPNALRLTFFLSIVALELPGSALAYALWLSLALPWLWCSRRLFKTTIRGLWPLTWWDGRYAVWSGLNSMFGQQLQGIDMIIVGALFSSSVAADYSIASRLATLFPFLQHIAARTFAPQAGALLANGDMLSLNRELARLRSRSFILTAIMAMVIIGPSPFYLAAFGDYGGAGLILIGLAAAPFARCIFTGIDLTLKMTGRAGHAAAMAAVSALVITLGSLLLHTSVGIHALALSMLVSAIGVNAAFVAAFREPGIRATELRSIFGVCAALIGIFVAFWLSSPVTSSVLCCVAFAVGAAVASVKTGSNASG